MTDGPTPPPVDDLPCHDERERIHRLTDDIDRMAYVVSHDLQEPLRTMAGFAELLQIKFGSQLTPEATAWIDEIVDACQRQKRRLDDLMVYSRSLGDKAFADIAEEFELAEAMADAMSSLSRVISEVGAEVKVVGARPSPRVYGVPSMVAQVFQNLIANSIKYRRDKPEIVIGTAATRRSGFIRVEVKDNGMGFDQKHAVSIFQIFRRLHSDEHKYPGTGIGLAVCRRIVEEHGGRIWAEGVPGVGAAFRFTLPVAAPHGA